MRAQKIDLEYLVRFTNAHWLVIHDPGAADDGLFARDADGKPLAFDKTTGALADATRTDIAPALVGTFKLPDGRSARPSFALIAERFLSDEYDPDKVAAATAIPAETIRRIARELAHAAFEQQVTLDIPWTDTAGRRHEKTVGPSGVDARHARHLGAFQRLPDLPDAASPANPAGLDRLPRRLPLQGAVPAADAAAEPAGAAERTRTRR